MGFGHRPNSHGAGLPSAKSLWSLAVSAKPSKASASQHKSSKASASRRKSSKASASRHKSSKVSAMAVRPSLQRTRPRPVGQVFKGFCSGRSAKSSKVSAPARWPSSHGLGQADTASGSRVGPDLSPVPVHFWFM